MAYTPITPVDVSPGSTSSWLDVDVSSYVPEGMTGVAVHCVNSQNDTRAVGLRKNGSTDDRKPDFDNETHTWGVVGIDENRIFECWREGSTVVWLVGYFDTDCSFFTNAPDKTPGSFGSYQDVNISSDTGGDTAIGALWEITRSGSSVFFGARENGASFDIKERVWGHGWCASGVDGSEIAEIHMGDSSGAVYLTGYIKSGVTFHSSPPNRTPGGTSSWVDLTALPANAVAGIYWVPSSGDQNYGFRKNGSSESILQSCNNAAFAIVECDSSQIIEGYRQSGSAVFYEIGYFQTTALELDADELEHTHSIAVVTQSQVHVVSTNALEHSYTIGAVSVDISPLEAAALEHTNELAQASLSGGEDVLETAGIDQANSIDTASIIWAGDLSVNGLSHLQSITSPGLDTLTLLTDSLGHAHELASATLSQFHALSLASLSHLHAIGAGSLSLPDPIDNAVFFFQFSTEFEVVGPPPAPPELPTI